MKTAVRATAAAAATTAIVYQIALATCVRQVTVFTVTTASSVPWRSRSAYSSSRSSLFCSTGSDPVKMTRSSGHEPGLRCALKKCTKMKITPTASSASLEWITR